MAYKKLSPFEPIKIESAVIHSIKEGDGDYKNYHVDDYILLSEQINEYRKVIKFEKGFSLSVKQLPADKALEVDFEFRDGCPFFVACFLEAHSSYIYSREDEEDIRLDFSKNSITMSRTTNARGVSIKHPGTPVKMVGVMIDPGLVKVMFKKSFPFLKEEYRRIFQEDDVFFNFLGKASPVLVSICESVMKIDYTSERSELLLRAKAMEILNHVFTEYMFVNFSEGSAMSQSDISAITKARDILIDNMMTPPTIAQLAKVVHINQFKLKKGFKEVFGNTIYGYLRQERMRRAKNLLESGDKNVSETAWDVGYTNVSHFISIFRDHYGVNPGTYLTNMKQAASDNDFINVE